MMTARYSIRHPNFDMLVDRLSRRIPRLEEAIDGAVWHIRHNPEGLGSVYIAEIDCWQARLDPPPVLLLYTFRQSIVRMLTIMPYDWQVN